MKNNDLRNKKVIEMGLITAEEVRKLFDSDNIWANKIVYLACKISVCMGLRMGEILALKKEDVSDDFISIKKTFTNCYGLNTICLNERKVPLFREIKIELDELIKVNYSGYLFSTAGGYKPISRQTIHKHFDMVLEKIGISYDERRNRRLCFHSLRMSFIDHLRKYNLQDWKIVSITGIASKNRLSHLYRYININFDDVIDIQEKMFVG